MIKIDTNLINPIISNFTENVFKNKINYGKDTIQQPFPFYYQESMTYLNPSKPSNYNDVGFSNCCYNHNQELYNFDNAPFLMNILYTVCSHYNIFVEQIVEIRSFLQPPSPLTLFNTLINSDAWVIRPSYIKTYGSFNTADIESLSVTK